MEDSKIITLFFARSEQAISELSNKYGKLCMHIADNILGNRQDAEECVNDAYLGAWNTIPPQNPNPLQTYICRIVRNIAITRYHTNTAINRNSHYNVALEELGYYPLDNEHYHVEIDWSIAAGNAIYRDENVWLIHDKTNTRCNVRTDDVTAFIESHK